MYEWLSISGHVNEANMSILSNNEANMSILSKHMSPKMSLLTIVRPTL